MNPYRSTMTQFRQVARLGALVFLFSVAETLTFPDSAAAKCGDANGDSAITVLDALVVLRSAVGVPTTCDGNCECDVDFDRELTVNDALETLRWAVGVESGGCGFQDRCFYDEDCEPGFSCGTDPEWSCDAACVPE